MAAQMINPIFFFILVIFVTSFSSSPSQISAAAEDYHSFCQKTNQTQICIQAIEAFTGDPKLKADVPGLLQILKVRALAFLTQTGTNFGDAIRSKPPADVLGRLTLCQTKFEEAANQYLSPLDFRAITPEQYKKYNDQVGFALLDVIDCISNFNRPPPVQNPARILTQGTNDALVLLVEGVNIYKCQKYTRCP
ncbi:OLC1v1021972C1 [Oldenlandia corymbosa var. corymbosa]|uniref:OLC1v1021972C1 n=1 Tax=Oldenlandia corymbosa var. corymbosa TaxID=529605 RepID=A0AAV1BX10_OLDCO|nr:OLC1v1021972C1 [Oldenlandia corymbosa var. corymbosa]